MLYVLKRHPLPIKAFFEHSLVLTYALPAEILRPLLPPGLSVDTHEDFGFIAVAMVKTRNLRPAFLPARFGQNFHLTGYRIFARYRTNQGRRLRGLRILRSDTDRTVFRFFGNLLTHYNYQRAQMDVRASPSELSWAVRTPGAVADLRVTADLAAAPTLSADSPFRDWREARRFAGPLPFTFDYERETHSIIMIEGVRQNWNPRPVSTRVEECRFLQSSLFQGATPVLASAFYVDHINYGWKRGVREKLPKE